LATALCLLPLNRLAYRIQPLEQPVSSAAGGTANPDTTRGAPWLTEVGRIHQAKVAVRRAEVFKHELAAARAELPATLDSN